MTTSTLMASGRLEPRTTIGTVNAAELAVAIAASIGFLQALGSAGVRWDITAAMLLGGVVAAPFAAWLVRHVNERMLGLGVGALILLLSADSALSLLADQPEVLMVLRVIGVTRGDRAPRRADRPHSASREAARRSRPRPPWSGSAPVHDRAPIDCPARR